MTKHYLASRLRAASSAIALGLFLASPAGAAGIAEALERPAIDVRDPSRAVLLSATAVGARWFAVGERGLILLSTDGGQKWGQLASPVSVTLTGVRFSNDKFGVAIGHGGVVLVTEDGGAHWYRRLDGRKLAAQLLAEAKSQGDAAAVEQAERLVTDGPDKPWLDLVVKGDGGIRVVGAYGLALESQDGGRTWTSFAQRLDNPRGLHLYAMQQDGDRVLIAGEQGLVFLSDDGGRTFSKPTTPYKGSFFVAELLPGSELFVAGLRGNAFRSTNGGQDWSAVRSPMPVTITGSSAPATGPLVLANQAGVLMTLGYQTLIPMSRQPLPPVNGLLAADKSRILALTVQGPMVVSTERGAR